jgi:outer membrane lipoprotein-sorting protein
MNVSLKTITVLSMLRTLTFGGGGFVAEGLAPAIAQSQPTADPAPKALSTDSKTDLGLLLKAGSVFFKGDTHQIDSSMEVRAQMSGTNLQSTAQIKTIAQFPKRFRTEVNFGNGDGKSQSKRLIVSNGNQVWIYDPDNKQYVEMTYEQFDQQNDSFWIGLSTTFLSSMMTEVSPEMRKFIAEEQFSDPTLMKELQDQASGVKQSQQQVNNQNYVVYEYAEPKDGMIIRGFIEPKAATFKQLQLAGKDNDVNMVITEQIQQATTLPTPAVSQFKFVPPPGAKKVKKLDIWSI